MAAGIAVESSCSKNATEPAASLPERTLLRCGSARLRTVGRSRPNKFTVGLALKLFVDSQSTTPWGQLFAMSLVSVLPGRLIFFFAQKHIVEGIATSGLKG